MCSVIRVLPHIVFVFNAGKSLSAEITLTLVEF